MRIATLRLRQVSHLVGWTSAAAIIVLFCSFIISLSANAQITPVAIGSISTPNSSQQVFVSGSYAYVTINSDYLQIFDISNPAVPIALGSYNTPDMALDVAVSGSYAYVADNTSGLQIINVSNPSLPTLAATVPAGTIGSPRRIVISGNYAYVASLYNGLRILDISNPLSPVLIGSYNTSTGRNIFMNNGLAYIDDGTILRIIDVSSPASPILKGSYSVADSIDSYAVSGNYLYIGSASESNPNIRIIDISNPSSPVNFSTQITNIIRPLNIQIKGGYLHVANGSNYLIFTLIDPAAPWLALTKESQYSSDGDTMDVFIRGNYAYIADGLSFKIVGINIDSDITSPTNFVPTLNSVSPTNNTVPILTFSATDNSVVVDLYEVKIDSDYFYAQTSPYTFPTLTEGTHTITVRAYDAAGNYTDGSASVVVDLTSPASFAPIIDAASPINNPIPILTFSTTDNIGVSSYQVKVDSGDFSTQTSPYTFPILTEGTHTITVRAYDAAGNYTDGTVTVVIDLTAPTITLNGDSKVTLPIGSTYTDAGATATDNLDGTIASSSIVKTGSVNTAKEGSYFIVYNVTDTAGNTAAEVKRHIVIKSVAAILKDLNKNIKADSKIVEKVKGGILLQVQSRGEMWYVNPKDGRKYSLGRAADAFAIIKKLGIGISNADLAKIPRNGTKDKGNQVMMNRLKGKILIQVQGKGQAWYVHPVTGKRYLLGTPIEAFKALEKLGKGITNANLNKVPTGVVVR